MTTDLPAVNGKFLGNNFDEVAVVLLDDFHDVFRARDAEVSARDIWPVLNALPLRRRCGREHLAFQTTARRDFHGVFGDFFRFGFLRRRRN